MRKHWPNMKIDIEISDTVVDLLGEGVDPTIQSLKLAEDATVADALKALGIAPDAQLLLILDERVVPHSERDALALHEGAALQILPPLKGG